MREINFDENLWAELQWQQRGTAAFVGFCVRACRSPPITTRRLRTVLRRRRPRPARAVRPCVAESNGIHFPWDIKGGILGDAAT